MRTRNLLGAMVIGALGVAGVSACGGAATGSAATAAPTVTTVVTTTSAAAASSTTTTVPAATSRSEEAAPKPRTGRVTIPNGDRQVVVSVVDLRGGSKHPLLHIDDDDRIDARGTGVGERTGFSFQQIDETHDYQIQTVRTRGSEPDCVTAQTDGTLRLKACDTGVKGQHFRLRPAGDDPARFTLDAAYGPVAVGDGMVYQDPDQDPWVLTAKDTGSYSNIYGD